MNFQNRWLWLTSFIIGVVAFGWGTYVILTYGADFFASLICAAGAFTAWWSAELFLSPEKD